MFDIYPVHFPRMSNGQLSIPVPINIVGNQKMLRVRTEPGLRYNLGPGKIMAQTIIYWYSYCISIFIGCYFN